MNMQKIHLSRKRIFDAVRLPVLPSWSVWSIFEYWKPPSPNERVPQTLGKM